MKLLEMFAKTPTATALKVPELVEIPEEWVELSRKLDTFIPEKTDTSLEEVLLEVGVSSYDEEQVDRYLRKHTPMRKRWCWKPLRYADVNRLSALAGEVKFDMMVRSSAPENHGDAVLRQYKKPVPYPVLINVNKIDEKMPAKSTIFLVSDYETKYSAPPDPFLMVIGPSRIRHIIERWDEPGFRDRSKKLVEYGHRNEK